MLIALLTAPALVLTGATATAATTHQAPSGFTVITAGGELADYEPGAPAVRYDPELVPDGARAHVFSLAAAGTGTNNTLAVSGLLADREYGAHVHTNPCGETGDAAGPHFQNVPDPVQPSVDPAYANPNNEVWLDFTTDPFGNGFANSQVDWRVNHRDAGSVVIHETHTHTEPGNAGEAGARLACINVAF